MQDPASNQLLPSDQIVELANSLFLAAYAAFERRVLVISGEKEVVRESALSVWHACEVPSHVWVGEASANGVHTLLATQALKTLGSEHSLIVFDAWSAFHPDAFCALVGSLVGGGVLILLTPPLAQWPAYVDPDYARMVPYGYAPEAISGRFLQRLRDGLLHCSQIICWDAARGLCDPHCAGAVLSNQKNSPPHTDLNTLFLRQSDQANAAVHQQELNLQALESLADQPPNVVVITADRGRGKSALLGRLAARLMQTKQLKIVVTASSPQAAAQAHRWAQQEAAALGWQHDGLTFVAPDVLLAEHHSVDVLLVDEAAMLPITLLQQLINRYPRMVLASTVHGYEGSGRGLAIKLMPWLDRNVPGWQSIPLTTPMRWREGDPLEAWLAEVFCLAEDVPLDVVPIERWRVRRVSPHALLETPAILHRAFGLLVSAHYRTTPSDLRDLLDGPNLSLWLLELDAQIAGVCLVAHEGPFAETPLRDAILAGKRRPRGHLLPQAMAFHCHSPITLTLRCARIVRIAIAPPVQGQGWGGRLLGEVEKGLAAEDVQVLGTSFALEASVLRFWQRAGLQVLRLGATRESASGLPSCLMAKGLSTYGTELQRLAEQFLYEAPRVLPVVVPMLDAETYALLLKETKPLDNVSWMQVRERVERFASGALPFESALGALQRWWQVTVCTTTHASAPLGPAMAALSIAGVDAVLAGQLSLLRFAHQHGLTGRDAAIRCLREIFTATLETVSASSGS